MKKSILLISAVCAAACALTACGGDKGASTKSELDGLNSMLDLSYSGISITVSNKYTEENITLKSVYEIEYSHTQTTVEYKVERFAPASLDNPTADVVTTVEGTAVIKNGTISDNDAGITADIAKFPLVFKDEYFENVTLTDTMMKADVKDASGFLGKSITCTDMTVKVIFLECIYDITVNYRQTGHEIVYTYVFNS